MKKSIIASAVVAVALGLAACTEEAKAAGATVYGSIEQRVEVVDGVADVNGDSDGNFVGVMVSEDLGNGASAFANISMDFQAENDNSGNAQGVTQRDAYVGLTMNGVTIQAGRQETLTKKVVGGVVDTFEGTTFGAATDRVDSAVVVTTEMSGVTLGVSSIVDNGNQDDVDSYELSAGVDLGGVNVGGVFTKDRTTGDITKAAVASVALGGLNLGGAYEIAANSDVTMTAIASTDIGANTLRAGIEDVENGNQTYIAEAVHNFSKSTAAYVNYAKEENADATTMVGLRMTF